MSRIERKHLDAADAMLKVFAMRLGKERGVHAESAIAAAARMAGTMLFRSFGLETSNLPAGTVVLSDQANEKGPELLSIVARMMGQYALQPDKDKLARVNERGEPPKLTVLEMQELFDADLTEVRRKHGLSQAEGAQSCALATASLIRDCAPQIGLEVGFNLAAFSFIEGCKTVPRASGPGKPTESKHPWYRLWK